MEDCAAFLAQLNQFYQHQLTLNALDEKQTDSNKIKELTEVIAVDHQILKDWLQEAGHAAQASWLDPETLYPPRATDAYELVYRALAA
ncbi:hypothetical protein [Vreelandella sp. H-I2]